jgi:hypothetical protein
MPGDKNVLIIGSGPSAYITALTCLEHNINVTIASPIIDNWQNSRNSNLMKKLILKRRFAERNYYKIPNAISEFQAKKIDAFENFNIGGLSNIWGGVFLPPNMAEFRFESKFNKDFMDAIEYVESIIPIKNQESVIYKTLFNGEKNTISIEETVTLANAESDKEVNWSASVLETDTRLKEVRFIDSFVDKIESLPDQLVKIKFIDDNKKETFEIFDKVYIGAGVFGTARILLNSLGNKLSFEVSDSTVTTCLVLKLTKESNKKFKSRMTPESLYLNKSNDGKVQSYAQIYKFSTELIESFKYKPMHKLMIKIFKVLKLNLRLVMFFHPADSSQKIILSKRDNTLSAKPWGRHKYFAGLIKALDFCFKRGYLPLTPLIKMRPGAGVHSGAFIKFDSINHQGKIDLNIADWPNVHVVGSATLPIIPTGPIMLSIMANSRVIALNSLRDFE